MVLVRGVCYDQAARWPAPGLARKQAELRVGDGEMTCGILLLLLLTPLPGFSTEAATDGPVPDSLAPRTQAWTVFSLGLRAEFGGDYEEALRQYREAERLGIADAQVPVRKALCLLQLRRFDEARDEAARALAQDSLLADAHWVLGSAEAGLQNYAAAVEPLRRAIAQQSDTRALHLLANVLERLGRLEEAIEPLTLLWQKTGSAFHLQRRAELLEKLGRLEEAAEDYWDMAEQDLERPGAVENLERVLKRLGRKEELIRLHEMLVRRFPDRADQHWDLIRVLIDEERWDDAEAELAEYRALFPDDPLAILQMGLVAHRRGESERGLLLFEEAWRLAPDVPRIVRWRMRMMLAEGMIDSALVNAERLLRLRPDDTEAWRVLALGRFQKSDLDGALRALQAWAAAAPEDAEPWLLIASIHRTQERPDEGMLAVREALRLSPDDADVLLEYASFLEETGQLDQAERVLRPLIAGDSADARALNFVGYMLVDNDRRLDEAEGMILEALDQEPGNPAFLDSMGWLWYKRSNLSRAEDWLRKAVEEGGRHPEIFVHLARVQIERKRQQEAIATLRRGLELNPRARDLQELLDSLDVR